ncbi:MAG: hypothetical protein M1833_003937 [Piccolia ochrophora]|nr:MAG: hypothetical protein M1833_003937 [Piccolia ochrophora]
MPPWRLLLTTFVLAFGIPSQCDNPTFTVPLKNKSYVAFVAGADHEHQTPMSWKSLAQHTIDNARAMQDGSQTPKASGFHIRADPNNPDFFDMKEVGAAWAGNDYSIDGELLLDFTPVFFQLINRGWNRDIEGWVYSKEDPSRHLIAFRVTKVVPEDCIQPHQTENIHAIDVAEIALTAKHGILEQVTKKDLLIFVGNGGGYIGRAFVHSEGHKTAYVPFDGDPPDQEPDYFSRPAIEKHWRPRYPYFKTYLLQRHIFGRTKAERHYERVILIDCTLDGIHVSALARFIQRQNIYKDELFFINIGHPSRPPQPFPLPPNARQLGTVMLDFALTIDRLTEALIGRGFPPYPWMLWDRPPEDIDHVDYIASAHINKVLQVFANEHPLPNIE